MQWISQPHSTGFVAQTVASLSAFNIPVGVVGSAPNASPVYTGTYVPNSSIQFRSAESHTVLTITGDGDVIWSGKPSEAADILVRSFQMAVENKKGVTKAARRRYYWKAVDNLAKKSERMSADEFVDFVRKQAYNRETRVIIDTLKGTNE